MDKKQLKKLATRSTGNFGSIVSILSSATSGTLGALPVPAKYKPSFELRPQWKTPYVNIKVNR